MKWCRTDCYGIWYEYMYFLILISIIAPRSDWWVSFVVEYICASCDTRCFENVCLLFFIEVSSGFDGADVLYWYIHFTFLYLHYFLHHTGQCKRTGGCYNELVVTFYSTGGGVKGKKIYTCWLYYLFINLHLFYLWWHLAHRPPVTLQFMALPSNWWFNSWFGLQIQHSSRVLPWQVLFSSVTAKIEWNLHV